MTNPLVDGEFAMHNAVMLAWQSARQIGWCSDAEFHCDVKLCKGAPAEVDLWPRHKPRRQSPGCTSLRHCCSYNTVLAITQQDQHVVFGPDQSTCQRSVLTMSSRFSNGLYRVAMTTKSTLLHQHAAWMGPKSTAYHEMHTEHCSNLNLLQGASARIIYRQRSI